MGKEPQCRGCGRSISVGVGDQSFGFLLSGGETFPEPDFKETDGRRKRAWDFKVKQYEDERAREQRDFEARIAREQRDFDAQQAREIRNAEIRRQEIEAARQAAVEYARNQPDVVYYSYNQTVLLW